MPIYSYHCQECRNDFDLLVGVTATEAEKKCPSCGSKSVKKILAGFSVRMGSSPTTCTSSPSCATGCCPIRN